MSALAGTGAVGMLSPAPVDGRCDREILAWLSRCGQPVGSALRRPNQVHGALVLRAETLERSQSVDADGVWTQTPGEALAVVSADCAPVWIAASGCRAVALVHAGWRGVAAGVINNAVAELSRIGAGPSTLRAAIGPHLRPCCFEVGPEVAVQFADLPGARLPVVALRAPSGRDDSWALDLGAAIIGQLRAHGIPGASIACASACTRCGSVLLHSYRRNGSGGPLMAAWATLQT
ncbi:MAG: polyphenol oxidase family protein [Candidatus Eremiobacteraeota bacterium]|nr:polyphenol oxidase family protein [Candidatus Eremiobacteraeota bacterium]